MEDILKYIAALHLIIVVHIRKHNYSDIYTRVQLKGHVLIILKC